MPLRNGTMKGEAFEGFIVCDACGVQEKVTAHGDTILGSGEHKWRHFGFNYVAWTACSDECERPLLAAKQREDKRDAEARKQKVKPRAMGRPFGVQVHAAEEVTT